MERSTIPPPDLEIRVRTVVSFGRTQLSYSLHSLTGMAPFTHLEIAGPILQTSPEELHRSFLQLIEALGTGRDLGGALVLSEEVDRKLIGLGRDLWRQLFTEEMRQAYRRFRLSVRSLLIISDEPWIPWEMVKPFDDEGEILDDPFFAERFELTRWLAGKRPLPGDISVHALACITGPGDLPLAAQEKDLVTRLVQAKKLRDATPAVPSVSTLTVLLEKGGLDLLHFALHGTFDPAMPNEAGLPLVDGSVFRPSDLHGPVQAQIGKDRPFVILNACCSGRQAWTWSGLGGWADRWVRVCGCGTFIGPLWTVSDSAAYSFSLYLYSALARGETLGRAAQEARGAVREAAVGDPSWLAYTVYGHPNARVHFGDGEPEPKPAVTPGPEATSREDFYKQPLRREAFEQFVADGMKGRQERALAGGGPSRPPSQLPATQRLLPAASTNLRIRKHFSDQDRDKFIEDVFEFMASFFKSSLGHLEQQNNAVGTRFRRIDSDHFSAAIYVQGEKKSSCRIWLDRGHLGDIAYFANDSGSDNSYNEALRAENDGYTMWLRPSGLQIFSASRDRLSAQEASEYFWAMLVGRLQ